MDETLEIKARLPIEQLVSRYMTLKKKGRNFVGLCPFHKDTHPSLLVSPDKGIAYCFACQKGGDIFSFYQLVEGCEFREALKDLAEQAGVELRANVPMGPKKDERERLRSCLESALQFYKAELARNALAQEYLVKRSVPLELREEFALGFAPDSFSATYDHLLKEGFSRSEIVAAGLGVQKDLAEGRIYDRFRNRLMFPIHDAQGHLVGFGGRTLGSDDAKYVNTAESPLYRKSQILFGLHLAKEAIRETGRVILVEGYFDVLACRRSGVPNVVGVSGTALTQEHVALLKRYAGVAVLCLDQDRAGKDAAERAFDLLSRAGVLVEIRPLPGKDPDEVAGADPSRLRALFEAPGKPYLEAVLEELAATELRSPLEKRTALERLLRLVSALPTAVEREDILSRAAGIFRTTETALLADLDAVRAPPPSPVPDVSEEGSKSIVAFTSAEISLGLLALYPKHRSLREELISPEHPFAASVFAVLGTHPETPAAELPLPQEHRERLGILLLFCENHGFEEWSESMAVREIRRNIQSANRDVIRRKQRQIGERLLEAKRTGKVAEEMELQNEMQRVLRLAKMAS